MKMKTNEALNATKRFIVSVAAIFVSVAAAMAMSGNGSEDDPYIISSVDDLKQFGNSMGTAAWWELDHDIENVGSWDYSWQIFSGHFNGNGHKISGITIVNDGKENCGFIPKADGAVIENVIISGTLELKNTTNSAYNGLLVGRAVKTEINSCAVENSTVSANSNITGWKTRCCLGALVGSLEGASKVSKCKSVNVSFNSATGVQQGSESFFVGGLVGYMDSSALLDYCGVMGADINLSTIKKTGDGGTETYNGNQELFAVGGVVGVMDKPSSVSNDLLFNGKISAPRALVGPVAGSFTSQASATAPSEGYAGKAVSSSEMKKTDSWLYNDYQLGVIEDVEKLAEDYKNYDASSLSDGYLSVDDQTFERTNSVDGNSLGTKTVLWYSKMQDAWNGSEAPGQMRPKMGDWVAFPSYYSYYMQGVNAGKSVSADEASEFMSKLGVSVVEKNKAKLTDDSTGMRGTGKHTISVSFTKDEPESWKWYVDDVAQGEAGQQKSITVAPSFSQKHTIKVEASDGTKGSFTLGKALLDTRDHTSDKRGTKANPYTIGSEEELRLWAEYSNMNGKTAEGDGHEHFNSAYYELAGNIALSDADFMPICNVSPDRFDQSYAFTGHFDGKGYIISNLHVTWRGASFNEHYDNRRFEAYGLFGVVGGGSSKAVIENLVVSGAVLSHDQGNTSFVRWDSNSNSCAVGVVAGIVGNNATIQNIDINKSSITDKGVEYNIAQGWHSDWLCVGGVAGRVQRSFKDANGEVSGITLRYLSAKVDIDITKAALKGDYGEQYAKLCIGGIVGAMEASSPYSSLPWPEKTYFSGKVNAPMAFVGPVFASAVYGDLKPKDFGSEEYCRHYAGQPTKDTYFKRYYLDNTEVTDKWPTNICDKGTRTVALHSHEGDKNPEDKAFNGVNRGEYVSDDFASVMEAFSAAGSDDAEMEGYEWGWSNEDQRVVLGGGDSPYLMLKKDASEENLFHATLKNVEGAEGFTYKWYINEKEQTAATGTSITVAPTTHKQELYCVATNGSKTYTSGKKVIPFIIDGKSEITASLAKEDTGDNHIMTATLTPSEEKLKEAGYTVTYSWTNASNPKDVISANGSYTTNVKAGTFYCHVTVKDSETEAYSEKLHITVGSYGAVFICPDSYNGKSGNDDNDGYTPDTPVKTWKKAYSILLAPEGSWDENKIVLMGNCPLKSTTDGFSIANNLKNADESYLSMDDWNTVKKDYPEMFRNVTITGKIGGVDYGAVIETPNSNNKGSVMGLFGDTRFEHLTFKGQGDNTFLILSCQYNSLEMGEGIVCKNFPIAANSSKGSNGEVLDIGPLPGSKSPNIQIFGGFNNDKRYQSDPKAFTMPHGKDGFQMIFRSGRFGTICVGGRQANGGGNADLTGIMGAPNMPVKCKVLVDIDREWNDEEDHKKFFGETVADYDIAAILSGNHEGSMYGDVDIEVRSGKISRLVNGILGALRHQKHTVDGVEVDYPTDTYFGRANILIAPEGETAKERDSRVLITELYGGGLGRNWGSNQVDEPVKTFFYGENTITVMGGTFGVSDQYDGYDDTEKAQIFPGIYGSGAGGINGIGYGAADKDTHNTTDDKLPYWIQDDKGNVNYGDYATYISKNGTAQKVYVTLANGTKIDPQDTKVNIVIDGGVFEKSLNGVFGGGNGFVNERLLNVSVKTPNPKAGSVYAKSADSKATSVTINGGEFYCNVYAGSRGNDTYYKAKKTQYTSLAQIYGNTELTINGGVFYGNVYGGGFGAENTEAGLYADMAKVHGNTTVYVNNKDVKVYGNVYGGGEMAQVDGNTTVYVTAGQVAGEIFGGGKGVVNNDPAINTYADVKGNTSVFVNGVKMLWNEMYDAEQDKVLTWTGAFGGANYQKFISGTSTKPVWKQNHNIYGGGDLACSVGGTATVTVTRGAVAKELIEKNVWKNSFNDDANPHFYVFGGGFGAFTKVKDTKVTVGVEGYYTSDEDNTVEDQWSLRDTEFSEEGEAKTLSTGGQNGGSMGIYHNSFGIGGYTVLGVIGGGYAGLVGGNTDVNVGGVTFVHRVYGGGYGQLAAYNALPATEGLLGKGKSRENLGEVAGNTSVVVKAAKNEANHDAGVFGSVFGGGAGVESHNGTDFPLMGKVWGITSVSVEDNANIYGSVYGGGDVANVEGTATAEGTAAADGTATPAYAATVVVKAGTVYGNVFGGGKGRTSNMAKEYKLLGNVKGNTSVTVKNSVSTDNTQVPVVWGSVYGGGEVGSVDGNTHVSIDGGKIGNNIFGAGLGDINTASSSDVSGSTSVTVNGGEHLWDARTDENGNRQKEIVDPDTHRFINDHNIYGGGNHVSVVSGDANVTVNHGMMADNPYLEFEKPSDPSSFPQFSVLGGGYGEGTKIIGNANVAVQIGKSKDGESDFTYANQKEDNGIWQGFHDGCRGTYDGISQSEKDAYYGSTSGTNGYNRYLTSCYAKAGVLKFHTVAYIVGGGMKGSVGKKTNVTVSDQTLCKGVFGGGIGAYPEKITDYDAALGSVAETATVNILGGIVNGNVYGGGAGVPAQIVDGMAHDYTKMAQVAGTNVTVSGDAIGTIIFGKVFGGGDIANVGGAAAKVAEGEKKSYLSSVTIKGGQVCQQVFGGGAGRLKAECGDHASVGRVNGNTLVTIEEADDKNGPWLWDRVYGGGYYGTVAGDATLNVDGGHFGYSIYGGGYGDVGEDEEGGKSITSANVLGNTEVNIKGGEWCLTQLWDAENRNWVATKNARYSSQYDGEKKMYTVNHNIYGGGNYACEVGTYGNDGTLTEGGNATVNMTKGLLNGNLKVGRDDAGSFYTQEEWTTTYKRIGSFHFCVIGGGYGENTKVGNTFVNVNIASGAAASNDIAEERAQSEFNLLDIIGGGYYGVVAGDTHVNVQGETNMRRAFGGSFYADVQNTNVDILSAQADDIFGGGMMGDVKKNVNLNIGKKDAANGNIKIYENVYGGNDVSGEIDGNINVNIYGGEILNNVYGAGNGNYLYALDEDLEKVSAQEDFEARNGTVYPLVYKVPKREAIMSAGAQSSSEASRLVNINSFRPLAQYISLNLLGSAGSPVKVQGKVFGGGNTATVTKLDSKNNPEVTVNIGDYVTASEVYMGADGEAMFDESADGFLNAFKQINNIELSNAINWSGDPYNKAVPETYLPLTEEERIKTFPHIIDLYFQPVEMPVQPVLQWNGEEKGNVTGTVIGSFFCGGNRGNMDVTPAENGSVVDYLFPKGLVITDKLVGGCNNANFTRTDLNVIHEGGYLLGKRNTAVPMIKLDVQCSFKPAKPAQPAEMAGDAEATVGQSDVLGGGNIYGGCYKSGTINGDVTTLVNTDMVDDETVTEADLAAANKAGKALCNVYGAGYGTDSYIYGNAEVVLTAPEAQQAAPQALSRTTSPRNDNGNTVNSVYGGGEQGNVIGNTVVRVNSGVAFGSVCGGSYAGYLYGSAHVLVGTPEYYKVKVSGTYALQRADKWNNYDIIKKEIKLIVGDIISPAVYDQIVAAKRETSSCFEKATQESADKGIISLGSVYGGGYSLASGFTGAGVAGTTTVLKYTDDYNVDSSMGKDDPMYSKPTNGFGGNTTVLVADGADAERITISDIGDGGLFGDGHLSYAEGFRSGELKNYGYAKHTVEGTVGAKELNTIQRFDLMRLTDNCVVLDGARDYTINEVSTTPYSLARISELQLVSSINSDEALPTDGTKAKYRNYMGMLNNIHYVGAVTSNVDFTSGFHNAKGELNDATYKEVKTKYINTYEQSNKDADAEAEYKKRNDATAKNMIGVSSGYALKVQNVQTASSEKELYYGPIVGVVEMKLINVETGEGGGYVYADNIHGEKPSALESTGNFVFPGGTREQYVVDDCLSLSENPGEVAKASADAETEDPTKKEIHYWYLNGNIYKFKLHITGYTHNGKEMHFNADTSDGLSILEGAGDNLAVTKVKWKKHETDGYLCDLTRTDATTEKQLGYTLKLSASPASKLYAEDGMYAVIPRNDATTASSALNKADGFTTDTGKDLFLAMQLVDNVNNDDKDYYQQHLAEPCVTTIELQSGATEAEKKKYIIELTVNYVKSPYCEGNITVENCALPGEYIKIRKDGLKIMGDEGFAQNGEYWYVGKRKYNDDDKAWQFSAKPEELDMATCYTDPDGKYIMIPAYYFMNGYGVQYVYTCNNINDVDGTPLRLEVEMAEENKLTVHNYHQMKPRVGLSKTFDLQIEKAAQRAAGEEGFAQPRVYIKDAEDLNAFADYVAGKAGDTGADDVAADGNQTPDAVTETSHGAHVDFILQSDIEAEGYKTPDAFSGTLHGDGHVIRSIKGNLFASNQGKIFNLGIVDGALPKNAETGEAEGTVACCYTLDDYTVYDMNGKAVPYTNSDFKYGKVAYNLNQYYLERRAKASKKTSIATYVEDYYKNGDYQYARTTTEGEEYLRTNVNPHYAVDVSSDYDTYQSYHDTTHPVDKSRFENQTGTMVTYAPLYNEANKKAEAPYDECRTEKNDYIFFGQTLAPEQTYELWSMNIAAPVAIASHVVDDMTNRVWRVSGYNRSKKNVGYHFNALRPKNVMTWVLDPATTAVDFTCAADNDEASDIYYAPVKDVPADYYKFDVDTTVTQNLLVYTDAQTGANSIANLVKESIAYAGSTKEEDIKGHQVVSTDEGWNADLLHLVDKEDFNAPLAFTAKSAWYERNPETETGYVEKAGAAWESVCLPFSVQKAMLSTGIERKKDNFGNGAEGLQKEITFFYGDPTEDMIKNPQTNDKTLNHEFWLRGMESANRTKAEVYFKRPAVAMDTEEGFKAYTPYIMSFPGERFYEFDMTGQTVTMSAENASVAVTDDAVKKVEKDGYSYEGAFLNSREQNAGRYAIELKDDNKNAAGDKFMANAPVYPFRATLAQTANVRSHSMQSLGYVTISDLFDNEDRIIADEPQQGNPDDGVVTPSGLRIYAQGKRIVVVSDYATTLPVYSLSGQLVRLLDIMPGKSSYSGFNEGIYIADQKKIRIQ